MKRKIVDSLILKKLIQDIKSLFNKFYFMRDREESLGKLGKFLTHVLH